MDSPTDLWPADYVRPGLPADHCADVLAGSYDVPVEFETPPVILDVGANIGAFARWAAQRWPSSTIHCYEPQPDNYALLCRTIAATSGATIIPHRQAVFDRAMKANMGNIGFNCGEFSLMCPDAKQIDVVDLIPAIDLPRADILKVDAEGSEGVIFQSLAKARRLTEFKAIMFEIHAEQFAQELPLLLVSHGFKEVGRKTISQHRGEFKFVKA